MIPLLMNCTALVMNIVLVDMLLVLMWLEWLVFGCVLRAKVFCVHDGSLLGANSFVCAAFWCFPASTLRCCAACLFACNAAVNEQNLPHHLVQRSFAHNNFFSVAAVVCSPSTRSLLAGEAPPTEASAEAVGALGGHELPAAAKHFCSVSTA
jgi:hypothetical protein